MPVLADARNDGMTSQATTTPLLDSYAPAPSSCSTPPADGGGPPYGSTERNRLDGDSFGAGTTRSSEAAKEGPNAHQRRHMHPVRITFLLSAAFCYGCTMTTLFLLVLPIECGTVQVRTGGSVSKSVALGAFAAIAGASQLVCPLVGMLSDRYRPRPDDDGSGGGPRGHRKRRRRWVRARRMPYLLFGTFLFLGGIFGADVASNRSTYAAFTAFFAIAMVGINIVYVVMIALIPDYVPHHQTGLANGTLALLLVSGSLFGFAMFKTVLGQSVRMMYGLYLSVMATTCGITFLSANWLGDNSIQGESSPDEDEGEAAGPKSPRWWRLTSAVLSLGLIPTLRTMISDPLSRMAWSEVRHAYWLDPAVHHDFFVVTVSRLFYYLGLSAQCFFLYFIHDVIHERTDPEAAASMLAIVTTAAGAVTCYPVGLVSDRCAGGRRKPFVYLACAVLAGSNLGLLACTTLRQMVGVCATLGAANGVYLTMDTSLAVDTLPPEPEGGLVAGDGTAKPNEDGAAQLLGIWGVAGFVGSALGPLVGGPLLYIFGSKQSDDYDDDDSYNGGAGGYRWEGYAVVLSLSAFYFALSAASLRWIRDPHI